MKILIKNIDIITSDRNRNYIKNGNIGISGGKIEFVEEYTNSSPCNYTPDRVIDGKNRLVMPGLVNSHTHCGMTLLRNIADDLPLQEWLFNHIFPVEDRMSPEDIYWGAMLGIIEMIKSGTTAFADMYINMDEVARAVTETGIRANLSKSPIKLDRGNNGCKIDERQSCFEYYRNWNGKADGRIKVYVEVHSAYMFDKNTLKESAQLAKQCGTGIHIHLLETLKEREESINRYGMDSIEICEKCGLFDVPVIAAHCVHINDNDIRILKEKGVNVVHNPTSNLKLGSGIAPVPRMIDEGINTALGTDGAASNNNLNMFEEINLAALIHKGVHTDARLINADTAIRMATVNGAKTIGMEGETGEVKKGMKADLILLDTDKPHFYPINNPASSVVYSAQAADVDTVIIDGEVIMEKRQFAAIDEELVKYKVNEIMCKMQ